VAFRRPDPHAGGGPGPAGLGRRQRIDICRRRRYSGAVTGRERIMAAEHQVAARRSTALRDAFADPKRFLS
jgi:hypothetical protein